MPLSSVEIERRRALISKLKEETQELVSLLEKEKRIAFEEGGDCMLVFAILSLISYVNEYSESHSGLGKKNNS
jgi:NTP pyrophosphatase (non-canonical NTP hydrolase)